MMPNITFQQGNVKANIPIGNAIQKRLDKAQWWLDNRVMTDMLPYMPMNTGMFIANTQAISRSLAGTGVVCAGAPPMGRYLYFGKVMVDAQTGRGAIPIPVVKKKNWRMVGGKDVQATYNTGEVIFRFRKGAVLKPTARNLTYQRKGAQAMWFEVAKQDHLNDWVNGVQKILNGSV